MSIEASSAESMTHQRNQSTYTSGPAIVWYIAVAVTALHLATATRYGYFGDELYHMACGEHLAWGYVDQPPLIALATWFTRHVFGTSLFSVHLVPAIAGMVLVWLTGLLTRELGGGRFAQGLAALCSAGALVYLILFRIYTMNAFEPLLWMGCAHVLVRIIKTGNQRLWLWFGVLAGIGMENKYSMAVFGFAVVAGLLLTPERKAFSQKWIWIAGVIAFAVFLPNLIWNIQHHFPFLELMRNIRASGRDTVFTPLQYLVSQVFLLTPTTAPVWLLGVVYFLFWREAKRFRILGWTFVVLLATFILSHGKDYYASPAYPMLFAGGAIATESIAGRSRMSWLKPTAVVFVVAGILVFLPIGVPVFSPEDYLRYQAKLPFEIQPSEKSMAAEPMPHTYSWCFGWNEMVEGVSEAYNRVPADQRSDVAIFANDFAAAGAIDLIGPKFGLPKAISGHQNYWLWGPGNYTGQTMIMVGRRLEDAKRDYSEVTVVRELNNPYAAPWEKRPVLLCRGPKHFSSLSEAWPKFKNWD